MVKSAGYSVIAVTTAWMKLYYPKEFLVANLNSLLGKADKIQVQLNEARSMGIKVLGPDVNYSVSEFSIEGDAIRVGLEGLKNLGKVGAKLVQERTAPWSNIESFLHDMVDVLDKRAIEALAYSGALDSFGVKRKVLAENSEDIADFLQKVRKYESLSVKEDGTVLPAIPEVDEVYVRHISPVFPEYADEFSRDDLFAYELDYCGIYVSGHPLDGMAEFCSNKDIVPIAEILPQSIKDEGSENEEDSDDQEVLSEYEGRVVNILGLCRSIRPITTRTGKLMYSVDVEDTTANINVVFWPDTVEKLVKSFPNLFNRIANRPVIINGKVKTDSFGAKISVYSITPVDENMGSEHCPALWVEVPNKAAMARVDEILKTTRKVSYKGTQVIVYYQLPHHRKAKLHGVYDLHFGDFLKLKSDFKITPSNEVRKDIDETTGTVKGTWTV